LIWTAPCWTATPRRCGCGTGCDARLSVCWRPWPSLPSPFRWSSRRALDGPGASILLWIATAGLSERKLRESCADFAGRFQAKALPLHWRGPGVETLDAHLAKGDEVVVVTAAPTVLAQALITPLDRPIVVLGTSLKRRAGGWVADVHCRNQRKCQALAEAGHGQRWAYAYTDSLDDLPLLRGADAPMIVGCGKAAHRRLSRARLPNCRASAW
jgi:phosphatidylglycerophosphatase C